MSVRTREEIETINAAARRRFVEPSSMTCPVCSGEGKNPEHPALQCSYCGGRGVIGQ